MKNPNWTRDELILALHLYFLHRNNFPAKNHPDIIQLSEQLNKLNQNLSGKTSTFRNPNGVYMKLNNFKSIDPSYTNTGKVGLWRRSKGDLDVWNDYSNNQEELTKIAAAILSLSGKKPTHSIINDNDSPFGMEGRLLSQIHLTRERNPKLTKLKKANALHSFGKLQCEACGFVFVEKYGVRGEGIIEIHHNTPLYTLAKSEKISLDDLSLLCANCHRIIHAKTPWLTVDELKELIRSDNS